MLGENSFIIHYYLHVSVVYESFGNASSKQCFKLWKRQLMSQPVRLGSENSERVFCITQSGLVRTKMRKWTSANQHSNNVM